MVDISEAAVAKGLATVAGSLDRLLKKEKISAADKDAALARIKTSTRYDDLKAAQLVIEAATENFDLKVKILQAGRRHRGARGHHCLQHLVDFHHQAGRRDQPPRPLHRHALLQPGADDGAGRDHPRPADQRRHA